MALVKMPNNKGQSTIEMVVSITLIFGGVLFALTVFYLAVGQLWVSHQLYEAALCTEKYQTIQPCQKKLRYSVKKILPFGKIQQLKLSNSQSQIQAQFSFSVQPPIKLPFRTRSWQIKETIHLVKPLQL